MPIPARATTTLRARPWPSAGSSTRADMPGPVVSRTGPTPKQTDRTPAPSSSASSTSTLPSRHPADRNPPGAHRTYGRSNRPYQDQNWPIWRCHLPATRRRGPANIRQGDDHPYITRYGRCGGGSSGRPDASESVRPGGVSLARVGRRRYRALGPAGRASSRSLPVALSDRMRVVYEIERRLVAPFQVDVLHGTPGWPWRRLATRWTGTPAIW